MKIMTDIISQKILNKTSLYKCFKTHSSSHYPDTIFQEYLPIQIIINKWTSDYFQSPARKDILLGKNTLRYAQFNFERLDPRYLHKIKASLIPNI